MLVDTDKLVALGRFCYFSTKFTHEQRLKVIKNNVSRETNKKLRLLIF